MKRFTLTLALTFVFGLLAQWAIGLFLMVNVSSIADGSYTTLEEVDPRYVDRVREKLASSGFIESKRIGPEGREYDYRIYSWRGDNLFVEEWVSLSIEIGPVDDIDGDGTMETPLLIGNHSFGMRSRSSFFNVLVWIVGHTDEFDVKNGVVMSVMNTDARAN